MRSLIRIRTVLEKDQWIHRNFRYRRCMSTSSSNAVVFSFGDGSQGALGLCTESSGLGLDAYEPTRVPCLPSDITYIAAGHYHSLAVTSLGHLWAWGRNNETQLGRGPMATRDTWNEPKRVEGLDNVKVVAAFASGVVSSALGDDGSLWVWGKSKRGQLGLGKDIIEALVPSKVEILSEERIAKVAFGWGHCLAHTMDGKLFGWGYSADGRLGIIGERMKISPVVLRLDESIENKNSITSMVEEAEKRVMEGIEEEKNMPITWEPRLIMDQVADIACGFDHSLVLLRNGTLLSGGSNIYSQLGRSNDDFGLIPVDISFHPISIASGLGHSLAICRYTLPSHAEGGATSIVSWGWNQRSQLGRPGSENKPLMVDGLVGENPISVSGGRVHSIALTSNGEVWVWGCGKNGRLGLGCSADETEPILLDSLEGCNVLQAVSGFDHNLVFVAEQR